MRPPTTFALGVLAVVACAHPTHPTTSAASSAPPSSSIPTTIARIAPAAEPSLHPVGFEHAQSYDVDIDGRRDLVAIIPAFVREHDRNISFGELPPALVAHALSDGRFAVDDSVTRAALRALCPDAPDAAPSEAPVALEPGDADIEDEDLDLRVQTWYLDAFCGLAWGQTFDDVAAALRPRVVAGYRGHMTPTALVDVMLRALHDVHFSFTLSALENPFPPTHPTGASLAATDATAVHLADDAALGPACVALQTSTERLRARAVREAARHPSSESVSTPDTALVATRRCAVEASGAWMLRFRSLRFATEADVGFSGPMELAFVSSRRGAPVQALPLASPWRQGTFETLGYNIEAVFDWDGDGHAEAAVRATSWVHEGEGSSTLELYTVHDGAVAGYVPTPSGSISGLVDADHDQRPDLVLDSPWGFTDGCGMNGIAHSGPSLVAHSLVGGEFSIRDDVARAAFFTACGRLDRADDTIERTDRDLLRIACARAAGASPERIVSALRADHRGRPRYQPRHNDQEICYPFQNLAALALIAPPFATAH